MASSGSIGVIEYVESWQTDNLSTAAADGIKWVYLSDSDTDWARATAAARGLHAAAALAATDNHLNELCGDTLSVYGQNGYNSIEVLFQVDASLDSLAFNIGFNDDVLDASNTLPAELSTTTWTTNAATFVGLVYDADATNDDVHCMWINADVDSTEALADLRMRGATPAAGSWAMAKVELQDRGSGNTVRATFTWAQAGKSFSKTFNTNVDRTTALCPYIGFENRDGVAHNMYIKYIKLQQSIAD